jgi:hypothetical protein
MNPKRVHLLVILLAGSALAAPVRAGVQPAGAKQAALEKPADAGEAAFFDKEVLPILKANCYKCHGGPRPRGGLSLASRKGLLTGGDLGPAVSLEKPGDSLLLKAIHYRGPEMPPSGKLPAWEIDVLTRWVKAGAPWPESKEAVVMAPKGPRVSDADRRYWAYQPVRRPAPPPVQNQGSVRNPIDAFVLARLEAKGLTPAPPADRRTLVRRVWYDLTGLPPTPEQVDAFVNDPSPDAYEKLVDRLLASPHYGEKWGRHWLDLVRYAETNGFEFDQPKPFAWRYRDYVINAFNADKPYDQFLREQLAGDLLPVVTQESLIATGYYRLGQWDSGAADRLQQKYDVLDSILSTTGQVLLGLSVGCARCHDHKKDPLLQKDYYRLLAFFHNITDMGGKGLTKRVDGIDVMCVSEGYASPTHVLIRGNPRSRGEQVEAGFPEVLSPPGQKGAGGRLALADWLTDPKNPLTARVMVNRLWQHHFGRGIVPTPNDFGKLGEARTHPELLDWLASEFVAPTLPSPPQGGEGPGVRGWSIKPMHRLILTSSTYRMSSQADPQALAADPANLLFWRFNMRRLTAEEIRDSILAVSGNLNLKRGGPGVYPRLPKEVLASQDRPGKGWKPSPPEEAARRSVYVHVKRSLLVPQLAQFDLADTDQSCPVRFTTTVPTQALGMLNDEFTNGQARLFAQRLTKEAAQGLEAQVARAIRLTTGRVPDADELKKDVGFVQTLRQKHKLSDQEALRFYCLLLLNTNEFIYLD